MTPRALSAPRRAGLVLITLLVLAASAAAFAESYRGLYDWAAHHGIHGGWAVAWPLQVDVFIAVGELALFVALVDRWDIKSRRGAWAVTAVGLAVSVAGNVGHVATHDPWSRATAAVPPIAAAAALAVGLGVLKRVRASQPGNAGGTVPSDVLEAAKASMRATVVARNPLSANQLQERFSLTRAQATTVRRDVLASMNGHGAES